jgi:hypothetical protein
MEGGGNEHKGQKLGWHCRSSELSPVHTTHPVSTCMRGGSFTLYLHSKEYCSPWE